MFLNPPTTIGTTWFSLPTFFLIVWQEFDDDDDDDEEEEEDDDDDDDDDDDYQHRNFAAFLCVMAE